MSKGLSEEKIFSLYHALRDRAALAEESESFRESSCLGEGYFQADQKFMEEHGGKRFGPNLRALIDLETIEAIDPYPIRGTEAWTPRQIKILRNSDSAGLVQFQCLRTNYQKRKDRFPKEYPEIDPLFIRKLGYLQRLCIDPSYWDFTSKMKRRYPLKSDAIGNQERLLTSVLNGDYHYSISKCTGRHFNAITGLKRELRHFILDKDGNRFNALDIRTSLGRMLYILLKAYSIECGSQPIARQINFKGYSPHRGDVDRADLYSSLRLTPVCKDAFSKLHPGLTAKDREDLFREIPRFLAVLNDDLYEVGCRWISERFPHLKAPTRTDIKTAIMPFLYGKSYDYSQRQSESVSPSYCFGVCFENEFPAISKAIRVLKHGPKNDAHKDMTRYIQGLEAVLVQGYMAKDIFDLVEGVFIVQDSVFFIPRFTLKVKALMTAYMVALGFTKDSLKLENNTEPPTDWESKPKRRIHRRREIPKAYLQALQAVWSKA